MTVLEIGGISVADVSMSMSATQTKTANVLVSNYNSVSITLSSVAIGWLQWGNGLSAWVSSKPGTIYANSGAYLGITVQTTSTPAGTYNLQIICYFTNGLSATGNLAVTITTCDCLGTGYVYPDQYDNYISTWVKHWQNNNTYHGYRMPTGGISEQGFTNPITWAPDYVSWIPSGTWYPADLLIKAQIAIESYFNRCTQTWNSYCNDCDLGLGQIDYTCNKSSLNWLGIWWHSCTPCSSGGSDPLFDPQTNIKAMTMLMADTIASHSGDWWNALQAYQGGGGWPPYNWKVFGYAANIAQAHWKWGKCNSCW